jgi:DNA repair exonuclease SbcCD nuclease subunit
VITVVHAADLHIDSPLRGLGRLEGAPVDDLRLATRRAFVKLIDTCLEEQAALLVLAGDVFDGEWRDFNTGLFFVRELARLRDTGTQVVMVRGNHDAESVLARHIPLPEHVFTFSCDAPESRDYSRLGLAVHGQSYGARSVEDNLADAYPTRRRDLFNIGVLHTNAVASSEHGNYAPCTVLGPPPGRPRTPGRAPRRARGPAARSPRRRTCPEGQRLAAADHRSLDLADDPVDRRSPA